MEEEADPQQQGIELDEEGYVIRRNSVHSSKNSDKDSDSDFDSDSGKFVFCKRSLLRLTANRLKG